MSERLPESHCTQCGQSLDGAHDPGPGGHVPKEGDIAVCIECGNPMVYRADQTLRSMTRLEWSQLEAAERADLERIQAAVGQLHEDRGYR